MVSRITAAVFDVILFISFSQLYLMNLTFGINGSNGLRLSFRPINDNAPIVLPWYASSHPIISFLFVYLLASFIAPSTASVPEFVKYVEFKFFGNRLLISLHNFIDGFRINSP